MKHNTYGIDERRGKMRGEPLNHKVDAIRVKTDIANDERKSNQPISNPKKKKGFRFAQNSNVAQRGKTIVQDEVNRTTSKTLINCQNAYSDDDEYNDDN